MTQMQVGGRIPQWTVADRLRKAREVAGLSQDQLALDLGISRRSVSTYESGGTAKRPVLLSWALRCGVALDWLQTGEVPDPDQPIATPTNPCLSGTAAVIMLRPVA